MDTKSSHIPENVSNAMKWDDETKSELHSESMSMTFNDDGVILDQNERIKRFGVECLGPAGDGILFKAGTWKTGGEYTQKLIVRNVGTQVKKLKYKLPQTRFFSLAYPEVITLSPGMSTELGVIFRPVEVNPYDDTIFIRVLNGNGGFHVPVRATIEKLVVTSPFGVDLGFCPTFQTTSKTFKLSNDGEVDAPYRWTQPKCFNIEPSEGIIPVGGKVDITVSTVPTDASVLVGQAVCNIGEGVHAIIPDPVITTRLSAIGKYAYISLSESSLNFKEVLAGTHADTTKKDVILRNTSVVPAEWSLVRHENDVDDTFDVYPTEGIISPNSEQTIVCKFHALSAGAYSLDRFTFVTPGDCRVQLTLEGYSYESKVVLYKDPGPSGGAGAAAQMDPEQAKLTKPMAGAQGSVTFADASPGNSINFRDIEVGRVETRVIMLKNNSERDVPFSILCGKDSTFRVEPQQGVIRAQGPPLAVRLTFEPSEPLNFYRRVWVTCADRHPLFYDVMGSGYIRAKGAVKEQRPAPLRHAHVQAYRNRAVAGLGGLNPDQLDEMASEGTHNRDYFAQVGLSGTTAISVPRLAAPLSRSGDCTRVDVAPAHEFFIPDTDMTSREVTIDKEELNFGYTAAHKTSESKTVRIANHSNGKLCLSWKVPRVVTEAGEIEHEAFEVTPQQVDIGSGQVATFKVHFKPYQMDRLFIGELECFAYFKNQRTFRLVNDATLTPPWCLTTKAYGNTFSSGQLLATVRMTGGNVRAGKLTFPCCFDGEALYQSVVIKNTSNIPCIFRIEMGFGGDKIDSIQADDDAFSVRPSHGEIGAESHMVVYVRFQPQKRRKHVSMMRCMVNGSPSGKLLLEGSSTIPFLTCPDVQPHEENPSHGNELDIPGIVPPPNNIKTGPIGTFYMKPTCVGLSTTRIFRLRNTSRLPMRYQLSLPPEAHGLMVATPLTGLLKGNQVTQISLTFAPRQCQRYVFKMQAKVFPVGGRPQKVIDSRQPMGTEAPEATQHFSVLLVAPGEIGAIQFDPPRLSMDVRLVNTKETKDIYLENVSDSDLQYQLMYREEFVEDTGHQADPKNAKEFFRRAHATKGMRPLRTELKPPDEKSSDFHQESILCASPSGLLRARSRVRVPVTFLPSKAGLFDFQIHCHIKSMQGNSEVVLTNEEIALLRVSQEEREMHAAGAGETALEGLPLSASLVSRATFPKICIEDIRVEADALINDVSQLWKNFALEQLNTDLSKPLTAKEVKLNLAASPDLNLLQRYRFEFTPDIVGAPKQVVTMQLRNNGHLPTAFHLHFPNEKQMELENWCDQDEPSEELYKIICMLEELKLFTIEPHSGHLLPGQSCQLQISYSHSHIKYGGVHNLPVHVKLDQGKQFYIDFIGRTLPVNVSKNKQRLPLTNIQAPPPTDIMLTANVGQSGVYKLQEVPIGLALMDAPLQRVEIFNVSAHRAAYEIKMEPIDQLTAEHYGSPIIRIANPRGTIEPRSSTFVDFYFHPLEAIEYKVPVEIHYDEVTNLIDHGMSPLKQTQNGANSDLASLGSRSVQSGGSVRRQTSGRSERGAKEGEDEYANVVRFLLKGSGYDPREKNLSGHYLDGREKYWDIVYGANPPDQQLIQYENQLVLVSCDLIDLSVVPQNSHVSRLMIIRNLMPESPVEFDVNLEESQAFKDGLLKVYPTSGILEEGEHVVIDLNFTMATKSLVLNDKLKITVREIVKGTTKRRGAMPSKLLEKVTKKKESHEHESVVVRVSAARNRQLELAPIPEGKQVSMPNTITRNGEVLQGVKYGDDPMAADVPEVGPKGIGFEQSTFSAPTGLSQSLIEDGSAISAPKTSRSGATATSGGGSRGITGGSGSMSRKSMRKDKDAKVLHGRKNCFLVRIRGTVLPYESCCKLYKKRVESKALPTLDNLEKDDNFMHSLFIPPNAKYIPPINSAMFLGGGEQKSSGNTPVKPKLKNPLANLSSSRQVELRQISDSITADLFRSVLDSDGVKTYIDEVVSDATSCDLRKAHERGERGTLTLPGPITAEAVPQGKPVYGLYIDEVAAATGKNFAPPAPPTDKDMNKDKELNLHGLKVDTDMDPIAKTLRDPEFVELASEILRNTMYNLMQEASFEEFPILAEPLSFKMKK